jgi:DNA-binding HxlR family transcriptional regulator
MPYATAKMLTQHLRELERDGIVSRTVYPIVPPRVEYSLTAFGQNALPVMECMRAWYDNQPQHVTAPR